MHRCARCYLSSMTKSVEPDGADKAGWSLSELGDRLEEIVRAAEAGQIQRVVLDGRESVVVISAVEFERLGKGPTGQALIDAMQACPYPEFELAPSVYSPVREPEF